MKLRLISICLAAAVLALAALARFGDGADAAVGQVSISQSCSTTMPGTVKVTFTWSGAAPNSLQTWVDLSLSNNGFQPGTFIGAGPFGAGTVSYTWDGLISERRALRPRESAASRRGWEPSQTFTFATIACPAGGFSSASPASTSVVTGTVSIDVTAGMTPVVTPGGPGIIIVTLP